LYFSSLRGYVDGESLKGGQGRLNDKDLSSITEEDEQQKRMTQVINNWSDLLKLPTIGPFYAFSQEADPYVQGFQNIIQALLKLQIDLSEYWSIMKNAYSIALKETTDKAPRHYNTKEDFENYRKVAIEAFEDAFTGLFISKEFPKVYSKVSNDQMDLLKYIQKLIENSFQSLNLPTRSEINELTKDIHYLKRNMRDLKRELDEVQTSFNRSKQLTSSPVESSSNTEPGKA
jgi:poly[(R)-3-hydroxyalkanoate] polymerase subunit PhaE